MGLNRERPKPKFSYITEKEEENIREFYERHIHRGTYEGTIPRCPYHLEIIPNSVSYTVKIVCDVCEKKSVSKFPDIEFEMDVTDYDDW